MSTDRALSALADRVAELPRPLLVALDVDGTLAPIVDQPGAARVPDETCRLLRRLAALDRVHVALVTGRDAPALRRLAPIHTVWRAIEHGRRLLAPGERPRAVRLDPGAKRALEAFRAWAEREAAPRGALIEGKQGAIGVHVRDLAHRDPSLAGALLRRAKREAERLGLHARAGRAVCEAEVESGDKGVALERLVRATRARGIVYAGDDITDYPAIRLAVERGGIGIFVRSPERPRAPRGASASVNGPERLAELLRLLLVRFTPL